MKNVAGIFDNEILADRAVSELLAEGFVKDDISLLMSDQTRNNLFNRTDDEANRTAKGAVAGATIGGALGAILAGLTAAGHASDCRSGRGRSFRRWRWCCCRWYCRSIGSCRFCR